MAEGIPITMGQVSVIPSIDQDLGERQERRGMTKNRAQVYLIRKTWDKSNEEQVTAQNEQQTLTTMGEAPTKDSLPLTRAIYE